LGGLVFCFNLLGSGKVALHGSISDALQGRRNRKVYQVENDANHQAAAGAYGNVAAVAEVIESDLEAVAAGTRVVIDLEVIVKGHILDFDLVVDRDVLIVDRDVLIV
jgi:hypothetical protein